MAPESGTRACWKASIRSLIWERYSGAESWWCLFLSLAGYSGFFVHSDAFEDLSSFVPVFAQCLFVISKVMNWLVIRTNKYYIFSWVEGDSDISLGYGGLGNRRDVDSRTGWRRVVIDLLGCSRDVSGLARLSDLDIGGETCSDLRMVDWLFNRQDQRTFHRECDEQGQCPSSSVLLCWRGWRSAVRPQRGRWGIMMTRSFWCLKDLTSGRWVSLCLWVE